MFHVFRGALHHAWKMCWFAVTRLPVISNADSLVYGSEMWNEQTKCLCQKAILSQTERETQAELFPIETIGE